MKKPIKQIICILLLLMCLLGPVCPEPEQTEEQEINGNDTSQMQRQVVEYLCIRKIRIDIIIPLL